ncbi:unnamed protein product [Boreogadus saida]
MKMNCKLPSLDFRIFLRSAQEQYLPPPQPEPDLHLLSQTSTSSPRARPPPPHPEPDLHLLTQSKTSTSSPRARPPPPVRSPPEQLKGEAERLGTGGLWCQDGPETEAGDQGPAATDQRFIRASSSRRPAELSSLRLMDQ